MVDAKKVLKKYYGYDEFRNSQEIVIDNILNKKDVLAIMPTGAGKSLCYQIPALMFSGITIVISPLVSLMEDQVNSLRRRGINATFINSSLSSADIYKRLIGVQKLQYKILYIAPERLENESLLKALKKIEISMLAVDEAHCVSQWGHNFRTSYMNIEKFIKKIKPRPVVAAFTATATEYVKKDIVQILKLHNHFEITTGFDRPNLYFSSVNTSNKVKYVLDYLESHKGLFGIVYCSTRRDVEYLNHCLRSAGYNSNIYHAGLIEETKKRNQEDFLNNKIDIMIATNAFGMGIDKPNVSYVIHYNMPKNLEAYYQEAGRAGRDGNLGEAILLFDDRDIRINEYLIDCSKDDRTSANLILKEKLELKKMIEYSKTKKCLRNNMLKYFGEKKNVNCNNCDRCINDSKLTDVTIEVRKIISCIVRTKQRENMTIVSKILRGIQDEYLYRRGYIDLSVFGILKICNEDIINIINQLIMIKYLEVDENKKLLITDKAKKIILEKEKMFLRMRKQYKAKLIRNGYDHELFKLLKITRKNVAKKLNLPEFMICTDGTLKK